MEFDSALEDTEEEGAMTLGEPPAKKSSVEILVGLPDESTPGEEEEEVDPNGIYLAPLGRRFTAGLTDALVLLAGAVLFGIVQWRFCGALTLTPLNIVVLGLAAVFLIFAYFALFAAVTSATPGLIWMGCEIRNLSGDYPTMSESCWRGFGVLVSLSALMLGFIWAWFDSDTLTWHDRMSGTVVTLTDPTAGLQKEP
jgi:uncharacterized RDD family membrane protein YckC